MPTYAWIAVVVALAGVTAGTVWAGIQAFRAWRIGWPSVKGTLRAAGDLSSNVAALEARIATLERRAVELERAVERLSVSLGRGRVLLGTVQEARDIVRRVRGLSSLK